MTTSRKVKKDLIIGLMSGTSVDGIDAALVEFESSTKLKVINTQFSPFTSELRAEINHTAFNNLALQKNEDSPLHDQLARYYAEASLSLLESSNVDKSNISAIANHGQTVLHRPQAKPPLSLQLGNGQLIANLTEIPTVTQFRQADLEAGGQGAPLMPAFHNAIFSQSENSYILNLGGIANITRLGSNIIGFDTGPANTLLDQWVELNKGLSFDKNGDWAASGKIIDEVLDILMQDQYLQLNYPKSTGTDYFNLAWLQKTIVDLYNYEPNDIQATLASFTVHSVERALKQLNAKTGTIYVCGGGAQNSYLMKLFERHLGAFSINTTDKLGVPSQWVEAIGFAWLGYCNLYNIPSNLPSVTGAEHTTILGKKFFPECKS